MKQEVHLGRRASADVCGAFEAPTLAYSAGAFSSALSLIHVRDKGEITPLRGPDWDAAAGVVTE